MNGHLENLKIRKNGYIKLNHQIKSQPLKERNPLKYDQSRKYLDPTSIPGQRQVRRNSNKLHCRYNELVFSKCIVSKNEEGNKLKCIS